jgi:ATP-dependent 26S proteasome regulatory subunit
MECEQLTHDTVHNTTTVSLVTTLGRNRVQLIEEDNAPDLLDTALLRPGRFDKMLYLGVSDTHRKQATILEALSRALIFSSTAVAFRVIAFSMASEQSAYKSAPV